MNNIWVRTALIFVGICLGIALILGGIYLLTVAPPFVHNCIGTPVLFLMILGMAYALARDSLN